MRQFNKDAVREVNKLRSTDSEKELQPLTRVEGWDRVKMFADQCDVFNSNIEKELAVIGKEKHGEIGKYITRDTNKVSRVNLDATKEKFAKGIDKVRKLTKAETNTCGLDVPGEMDGRVKMKDLQKKYTPQMKAEFKARCIKVAADFHWDTAKIKDIHDYLCVHEMQQLTEEGKARDGIKKRM